jgi:hypothetical protein
LRLLKSFKTLINKNLKIFVYAKKLQIKNLWSCLTSKFSFSIFSSVLFSYKKENYEVLMNFLHVIHENNQHTYCWHFLLYFFVIYTRFWNRTFSLLNTVINLFTHSTPIIMLNTCTHTNFEEFFHRNKWKLFSFPSFFTRMLFV